MEYVRWFEDLTKDDVGLVGGKGANLGEMTKIGLPVPPGFVLTADAYWRYVDYNNLRSKIEEILSKTNINNPTELLKASEEIQQLFLNGEIPEDLKNVIIENYKNLSRRFGEEDTYVAVRSSATAEDLPNASFAGQQATLLNVKGIEKLLEAVKKCWASLWTARAINYRAHMGFDHMKVALAVVIQKQIFSKKSGIMFTIHPVTNDTSKIVIEASWGLGESVVSGEVTPDEYIVDKNTMKIEEVKINEKKIMTVYDEQTLTKKVEVPNEIKNVRCLSDEEVLKLAEFGKKIEEHYKHPQDIEFAIDDFGIWIVQTRPVTTIKKKTGKILLKGIAASPGIGKGKVKIILGPQDFNKFQKGDVLVTKMTNPDFEPLMAMASAIVTDEGGHLSHAAIVSRELGKPAVVGTREATKILSDGTFITVDGTRGIVYEGDVEFDEEKEKEIESKIYQKSYEITATKIFAIADYPETVKKIKDKIDGIGLLRLEFLILRERKHPRWYIENNKLDELKNILVEKLSEIARLIYPKPVIVRTFDLRTDEYRGLEGGDKEPIESNPMMGWHGIRRDLDQEELLITQIRAFKELVKNLGLKNIWMMIPFVISWEEVKRVKDIMIREGLIPHKDVKFGIMVETPAAALTIDEIIEKAGIDFISFGTNDLTQLTLGVDRNNEIVQKLMNEKHPAVLRLIERVVKICRKRGVYTSICGQAGSDPEYAEFLVKLGIDSISANVDSIDIIREAVARIEKKIILDKFRK
ncbi:MAG: phosphoenolpyruvate synthase [Candidatus Aenigmatarchaeota archaeon]